MFVKRSAAALATLAAAGAVAAQAVAAFQEPVTLSAAGREAMSADVAVDATGDAVFGWMRWDGANWRAQARARSAAGVLGPVQGLSAAGADATAPLVAVDPDGDAVFAWSRNDGGFSRVQARARSAAGVLSPVQTLSAAGQTAFPQGVVIDADGDALIVWTNTSNVAQVQARSASGVLGPVQDLNASQPVTPQPLVAVDGDGDAVLAWLTWDGANRRLNARARTAAGVLGPAKTLSAATESAVQPHLAVEPEGDAIFTWATGDRIQARRRSAAGTLGKVQTIAPAGLAASDPRVAVQSDGDAVFAWLRSDGANTLVQARGRAANGALSAVRNLSAPGQDASWVRLALDAGAALVSWQRVDHPDVSIVQARRRKPTGALEATQTLSDAAGTAELPQVAVAPGGDAIVAWHHFDGANLRIQAATGP